MCFYLFIFIELVSRFKQPQRTLTLSTILPVHTVVSKPHSTRWRKGVTQERKCRNGPVKVPVFVTEVKFLHEPRAWNVLVRFPTHGNLKFPEHNATMAWRDESRAHSPRPNDPLPGLALSLNTRLVADSGFERDVKLYM